MTARRILVAVDFSQWSRSALIAAAMLARRSHGDVHLVHAIDPDLADAAAEAGVDIAADARDELARFVERAGCGAAVRGATHVAIGSAADVICDVSRRENIDLVVMGVYGQSSGCMRCGTTAAAVVRHATIPTMFVPDASMTTGDVDDGLLVGRVVVALDLGGPSLCAAAAAIPLAAALGAELEGVHVVPPLRTAARWKPHADVAVAERLRRATGEIATRVRGLPAGGPMRWRTAVGDVARVLADATLPRRGRASLLVMGRHVSRHQECDPGSVAMQVLALAHGPVLLHLSAD
jgi:nucleotide-binding universal stress UspA family protein